MLMRSAIGYSTSKNSFKNVHNVSSCQCRLIKSVELSADLLYIYEELISITGTAIAVPYVCNSALLQQLFHNFFNSMNNTRNWKLFQIWMAMMVLTSPLSGTIDTSLSGKHLNAIWVHRSYIFVFSNSSISSISPCYFLIKVPLRWSLQRILCRAKEGRSYDGIPGSAFQLYVKALLYTRRIFGRLMNIFLVFCNLLVKSVLASDFIVLSDFKQAQKKRKNIIFFNTDRKSLRSYEV